MGYLRKKTELISRAINDMTAETPRPEDLQQAYYRLDEQVRQRIQGAIDPMARLSALLTSSPTRVDPKLYLHHYQQLEMFPDKNLLLKLVTRLAYHRQFNEIWTIIEMNKNEATLMDIEDYVDAIVSQLKMINYRYYGTMECVTSAVLTISNPNISNSVVDTFVQKYNLKKSNIINAVKVTRATEQTDYSCSYIKLVSLRKFIEERNNANKLDMILTADSKIFTHPGWLQYLLQSRVETSYLLKSHGERVTIPKLIHFIEKNAIKLNSFDILTLLNVCDPKDHHMVHQLYESHFAYNSSHPYNRDISSHFVMNSIKYNHKDVVLQCIEQHYDLVHRRTLAYGLSYIYASSTNTNTAISHLLSIPDLQTILVNDRLVRHGDKSRILSLFLHQVTQSLQQYDYDKFLHELYFLCEVLSKVGLLSHLNLLNSIFSKVLINGDDLNKSFFTNLMENCTLTPNHMAQIAEYSWDTKCPMTNDIQYVHTLFSKTLDNVWDKEQLLNQLDSNVVVELTNHDEKVNDFSLLYAQATQKDRSIFSFAIRNFSKNLSRLPSAQDISHICNELNNYVFSESFKFTQSHLGKQYVMDYVIRHVITGIDREVSQERMSPKDAIMKMRDLLSRLNFQSLTAQAGVFQYMVKYDPNYSTVIIQKYKNDKPLLVNPLMRGIIRGLLTNEKISTEEKHSNYTNFRAILKENGYKFNRLGVTTTIQLMDILVEIAEKDPSRNLDTIKSVLETARRLQVRKDIVAKWAAKLMVRKKHDNL
ncbi:hypothetical protein CAAN3_04S02432 [[Candida] anglica]